jgi:selenoprotein W-related protein
MHVELKYCSMWNYEPQAVSLTTKLLTEYKQRIQDLKLIPVGGGAFELSLNGELLYSKLKTGEFPDEKKMLAEVGKRLK